MSTATLKIEEVSNKIVVNIIGGLHHNKKITLSFEEFATLLAVIVDKGRMSMSLEDSHLEALKARHVGTWV
ncbi:MAG TPA: hypothetical protein VJG90_07475 [Candidatus Nanoarchaeia archaeon]|nr:hypothetical protein [Candidatus Nanoarchaeia archaeon]